MKQNQRLSECMRKEKYHCQQLKVCSSNILLNARFILFFFPSFFHSRFISFSFFLVFFGSVVRSIFCQDAPSLWADGIVFTRMISSCLYVLKLNGLQHTR